LRTKIDDMVAKLVNGRVQRKYMILGKQK